MDEQVLFSERKRCIKRFPSRALRSFRMVVQQKKIAETSVLWNPCELVEDSGQTCQTSVRATILWRKYGQSCGHISSKELMDPWLFLFSEQFEAKSRGSVLDGKLHMCSVK